MNQILSNGEKNRPLKCFRQKAANKLSKLLKIGDMGEKEFELEVLGR